MGRRSLCALHAPAPCITAVGQHSSHQPRVGLEGETDLTAFMRAFRFRRHRWAASSRPTPGCPAGPGSCIGRAYQAGYGASESIEAS
jgi:hypothetical protein